MNSKESTGNEAAAEAIKDIGQRLSNIEEGQTQPTKPPEQRDNEAAAGAIKDIERRLASLEEGSADS